MLYILPWRQSSHHSQHLGSQGLQTYERNSSCSKSRHPYLQCIPNLQFLHFPKNFEAALRLNRSKSVTDRSRCPLFQYSFRSSYRWRTWNFFLDRCSLFQICTSCDTLSLSLALFRCGILFRCTYIKDTIRNHRQTSHLGQFSPESPSPGMMVVVLRSLRASPPDMVHHSLVTE